MTEYRYAHLRANVPRRRAAYKWFFGLAILVFFLSLVDIIWFDEVMFWGIVAAYVVLFVWGLILLIALPTRQKRDVWNLGEAALHCPNCDHVFLYAVDHPDDPGGASLTCPLCGVASHLPAPHSEPDRLPLPQGEPLRTAYQCGSCQEHIIISTLGDASRPVRFEECPHCHALGTVGMTELDATPKTHKVRDWSPS